MNLQSSIALALALMFGFPATLESRGQATSQDASHEVQEKAAQQASDAWLIVFDSGKYEDNWNQASDGLKALTKKEAFIASLQAARSRVGKVLTRKLKTSKYAAKLPGAPEGQYVVLRYESSFEKLSTAVETVVPMLDKDGKWRVSGYHVDAAAPPEAEKAAQQAAQSWLALFDSGKYEENWEQASQGLKDIADKQDFIESLATARGRTGKVVTRKLKSSVYTTKLAGSPDGQYVVIQYESSFENLGSAIEVLVPMLDKDGKWRVSGYSVR
jgi:hypothetical protein